MVYLGADFQLTIGVMKVLTRQLRAAIASE